MKLRMAVLVAVACAFVSTHANASTADDKKWISQCQADNKGAAPDDVVLKYCTCMNNKMSESDTQTITQWEKSHQKEQKACDQEAGWK